MTDRGRAHLLVVDDDERLRSLLARYLEKEGYWVSVAADADQARRLLSLFLVDLVVLDVMMPGESGLDFLLALRAAEATARLPVLMLTARGEPNDRIAGFERGVDDYLPKPFEPRELALRVAAILRRSAARAPSPPHATRFGAFVFDRRSGALSRDGQAVFLTEREQAMLRILAEARGGAVARRALLGPDGNERSVDVLMTRLRRKIEPNPAEPVYLQTARGIGYRLVGGA